MAEQAERAFAQTFLNTLSTQPIVYADDYQLPPEQSLKRVPVPPIAVPPPPTRSEPAASTSAPVTLTFKSLKPAFSLSLAVHPTDSIADIKALLASAPPSAFLPPSSSSSSSSPPSSSSSAEPYVIQCPPAALQRLLVKGKALADGKLLKEYSVKEGDIVNLVVKPGSGWEPVMSSSGGSDVKKEKESTPFKFGGGSLSPNPNATTPVKSGSTGGEGGGGGHRRIPSVVLSPSPSEGNSPGAGGVDKDIVLTLDPVTDMGMGMGLGIGGGGAGETTYHATVADPEFWSGMYAFLRTQFKTDADVHVAFEDFLCAAKGSLTPSEIARIRDTVGVVGMAGT